MVNITLPTKIDTTSGVAGAADYETTIDSALDLYTAQVKNYPVADAFELDGITSQEFR